MPCNIPQTIALSKVLLIWRSCKLFFAHKLSPYVNEEFIFWGEATRNTQPADILFGGFYPATDALVYYDNLHVSSQSIRVETPQYTHAVKSIWLWLIHLHDRISFLSSSSVDTLLHINLLLWNMDQFNSQFAGIFIEWSLSNYLFGTDSKYCNLYITLNKREYLRANQKWTIQRNWQHEEKNTPL